MDLKEQHGTSGPKGEPGPYCANTELDLLGYIISEFEEAVNYGEQIKAEDGHNHKKVVDGWALVQALDVLQNYQALG